MFIKYRFCVRTMILLGEATIGGEETRLNGNYPLGNSGPIMDG